MVAAPRRERDEAPGARSAGWIIAAWPAALAILALCALALPAGAVALVGYYQTHTQSLDPSGALNGVSCVPGTTTCVATDADGDSFQTADASATAAATWTPWAGPAHRPAGALDCATTGLCEVVAGEAEGGGGDLYYATSVGGAFATAMLPTNGVEAVSCPSASLCVTAQRNGFVGWSASPAGTRWRFENLGAGAMTGVSCPSSTFCAVVDDSGHVHVATTEEDITEEDQWASTDVDGPKPLLGIGCGSPGTCLAVDGGDEILGLAIDGGGAATLTRHPVDGAEALVAVDCAGATCAAADHDGVLFASTDSGAHWTMRWGGGVSMTSVSCASASLCAGATTGGDVVTFNPATTVPPLGITTGALPAGLAGSPYEAEVQAIGGEPPYEWSATGMPPGLAVDRRSGRISGTPMTATCVSSPCPQPPATYTPTVMVSDENGTKASESLTIGLAGTPVKLTAHSAGTGSGEISSSPTGIDGCGTPAGSCEATYEFGTAVILTANPAPGSTFAGWSGAGCSGGATCRLAISADTDLSATFTKLAPPPPPPPPGTHELMVQLAGQGKGSVHDATGAISCPHTCSRAYADGTQLTLAATPAPGATFAGWSGAGCSGTGACRLTIAADTTVRASFEKNSTPARAHLRIRGVHWTSARLKLVVAGTVAKNARGVVKIKAVARLQGRRVSTVRRAPIHDGRWQARLAPGWARRHPKAVYIVARFAGSPGLRRGHATQRLSLG